MLPTLWPGDVVEIESCSLEDLRPGEIVLAWRDDCLVLHRFVTCCSPNAFLLRGDSKRGSDPQYSSEALLGRLVHRANEGCAVPAPALRLGFGEKWFGAKWFGVKWSRAVGMLLCHCSVARRLALKLHSLWKASARELRNPEDGAGIGSPELGSAERETL
jgi:hypothetical protein